MNEHKDENTMLSAPVRVPRKIIRMRRVRELISLSETTIWRLQQDGRFPMRMSLGARAVGWFEDEILEWMYSVERKKPVPPRYPSCQKSV